MATCSTCGNDYERTFHVRTHAGEELDFDSIECAVTRVAPECGHCGCRILGHGIQAGDTTYCCASCARHSGVSDVRDSTTSG